MANRHVILFLTLFLLAGVIFTWPLTPYFFSSIPYTLRPIQGFEKVPLIPGDHLQTYYWFWLFSDNLWGHSGFLTNPYEFNGPSGPMSTVYANFPFSILFALLLPCGSLAAYNILIILSFLLSGLAMFLLARTWTEDFWGALLAGLVFSVAPYRVSHVAGGQLFGYVFFLLPLCLYFVELTFKRKRWIYGAAAGLCIIPMSLMEPHTSFLTALTMAVYLPSRILLFSSPSLTPQEKPFSFRSGLIGAVLGGLSFSCFLWMRLSIKNGVPFWNVTLAQPLILGTLFIGLSWFYLSALFSSLTNFSFSESRYRIGKSFIFFLPLNLYALKYRFDIPHWGLILPVLSAGFLTAYLLSLGIKHRDRLWRLPSSFGKVLFGVGTGLAIASVYLMHIRKTVLLPSIAGKGRGISEVLLFSPRLSNLFLWQDINRERFVILGWGFVILACLGLIPLFKNRSKNQAYAAMAGIMAFSAVILTLGPTLTSFPIYEFLYHHVPFFNYPRVPGRFVMVGFIFLGLLSAMALAAFREWLASKGLNRLQQGLFLIIIVLLLAEYHTYQPVGLSLMTPYTKIYRQIRDQVPPGGVVLELPIWPGDSHQSSAYEYTVTQTHRPMVNGYAPVVVREYIRQVFWPLYPLDQGELGVNQERALEKLKTSVMTFHDNSMIFTEKVSPFPPRLALKRLMTSPSLKLIDHEEDVFLFKFSPPMPTGTPLSSNPLPSLRVKENPPTSPSRITSPVTAVFYANDLPRETGRYQLDPSASGYNLLMKERELNQGKFVFRPGIRGNVLSALPGKDPPGFLTLGNNRYFPSGKYRAKFRLKSGMTGLREEVGRIEITAGRTQIIAQKTLQGGDFLQPESWTDIPVEFEIPEAGEIGFRVYFSNRAPLTLNVVLIGFADQKTGPGPIEAEDLLRQTGTIVTDPLASGREAILARSGYHPPIYLCYGPYQTFEPGRYQAVFFLRLNQPPTKISNGTEAVLLEIATDMGKRIFARRQVKIRDLTSDRYLPLKLAFDVPFRCELGYRVKYSGKADLLLDRISFE